MGYEVVVPAIRVFDLADLKGPPRSVTDVVKFIRQADEPRVQAIRAVLNDLHIEIGIFRHSDIGRLMSRLHNHLFERDLVARSGITEDFIRALIGADQWTFTLLQEYAGHCYSPRGFRCWIEPVAWARKW